MINNQILDRITIDAYNEFYKQHLELFKKDRITYWQQAIRYKEYVLLEYKLNEARKKNNL